MSTEAQRRQAADPSTAVSVLEQLASICPDLRGRIFYNPSCPPELKEWLRSLGEKGLDQTMVAALAQPASGKVAISSIGATDNASLIAPQPQDRTRSSRKRLNLKFLVLILVGVLSVWGITNFVLPQFETGSGSDTSSASEDAALESVMPAPADALSYAFVDTPSKNISCELTEDSASCSILERDYSDAGLIDCPDRLFSIVVDTSDVHLACGEEFLGEVGINFYELQYGETTVQGDFACYVEESGMKCWNQTTGHGFIFARQHYSLF